MELVPNNKKKGNLILNSSTILQKELIIDNFTDFTKLDRNRPRTVVFYGRVSTEHEAQLSALENQMQWYGEQAKYHSNWTVIDKYIDEGITGTQAKKRPSFLKMIEDAKLGKFDLIVTREVCRFARNTVDTLNYTRALKNIGVEVFFVDDNIWTMDGDGELRLSLMATLAQEESRKISERVKAGQRISRENKTLYGNGNILGYNRVGGTYVVDEEQAATVRMIFDMYVNGMGETAISKELMKLGRKAAAGRTVWDAAKVGRVLKNATYMGYICYNKSRSNNYLEQKRIKNNDIDTYQLVKGDFEPLVSEELWYRCDRIRKSKVKILNQNGKIFKKGVRLPDDMWLRKLKCKCGSTFRRNRWRVNKRGDSAFGYQCYHQLNNGSTSFRQKNGLDTEGSCDVRMIADWKIELMAHEVIKDIWQKNKNEVIAAFEAINKELSIGRNKTTETVKDIDERIEKLQSRISAMVEMRADGEITKEDYTAARRKAETEIKELKAQRNSNEEEPDIPKIDIDGIVKTLEEMPDISECKLPNEVIDSIISSVRVIDNDHYEWIVKLSPENKSKYICSVGGRKNNAVAKIEGISPLTYYFCIVFAVPYKNTDSIRELHRLHSRTNQNQ